MIRWPLVRRAHIRRLETELISLVVRHAATLGDLARARAEADALRARLTDRVGAADLARAHKTLLDYEDMLATCRARHGSNSRSVDRAERIGAVA